MPDQSLDPELAALSAALGGLTPAVVIDRDRLLFEAGRRSVRQPWISPVLIGMFAILSTGLGVRLMTVPPEVQIVYRDGASGEFSGEPKASRALASGSPLNDEPALAFQPRTPGDSYLHLRDQVVRFGADSLPNAISAPSGPPPPVEKMLGLPAGTLSDTQKSRWEHQLFQGGV